MRRRGRQAMHFGSTLRRKRKTDGATRKTGIPLSKLAFAVLLAVLIGRMRGEILRLRVPTGNRKGAISGRKKSRDATLRMTVGGARRHFGAGSSANMRDIT
jgi:hypothetical protein